MGCRQKGCHARGPHGQVVGQWPLVGDKGVLDAGGPLNICGNIRRDDGALPRRRVNGSGDTDELLAGTIQKKRGTQSTLRNTAEDGPSWSLQSATSLKFCQRNFLRAAELAGDPRRDHRATVLWDNSAPLAAAARMTSGASGHDPSSVAEMPFARGVESAASLSAQNFEPSTWNSAP